MIGNADNAALALDGPSAHYIGEGCSRTAFLIEGVVYKVAMHYSMDNQCEAENIERIASVLADGMISHIRVPKVAQYGDVIAMEYIDGDIMGFCFDCEQGINCGYGDCIPESVANDILALGITDLAFGNIILKDDVYYIVDAVS